MSLHETSIGNLFLAAISPSISLQALSPLRFLFRMQRCIWIRMTTFQYGYILCAADLQIDDFQVLEGVRCFVAYMIYQHDVQCKLRDGCSAGNHILLRYNTIWLLTVRLFSFWDRVICICNKGWILSDCFAQFSELGFWVKLNVPQWQMLKGSCGLCVHLLCFHCLMLLHLMKHTAYLAWCIWTRVCILPLHLHMCVNLQAKWLKSSPLLVRCCRVSCRSCSFVTKGIPFHQKMHKLWKGHLVVELLYNLSCAYLI